MQAYAVALVKIIRKVPRWPKLPFGLSERETGKRAYLTHRLTAYNGLMSHQHHPARPVLLRQYNKVDRL